MIIRAEWVVPVSTAPIRDGAIVVRGDRVAAVGPFPEIARNHPGEEVTHLTGCTACPGLVNAHTHLALTVLHGVVPPAPFTHWLGRLVRAMRVLTPDDLAASAAAGAHQCITSGTTVVGDIVYGPRSPGIAEKAGLGGAFFWEVLGIEPSGIAERLAHDGFPDDVAAANAPRTRYCISAHSPYTAGPGLISALHELAMRQGSPLAIHLAESPAETELLLAGSGPLAEVAARNAPDFRAPGTTPVNYLEALGALSGTLAIHCAEATADDAALLASNTEGVVLCPRSNAYLHVGPAPVPALMDAGARVAMGTDSLASNEDLDLFAEARAVHALAPGIAPERILRMMTVDGARALGLGDSFGTLEPGRQADIAAFRTPATGDPYTALLATAGRSTIEAVMSAGVWRVISGQPTEPGPHLDSGVQRTAARAAAEVS